MSDTYAGPKTSDYKVWHIPQIPGRAFVVEADSLDEARRVQDVLAFYDLFQYENRIKPDYSNVSGIVRWDDREDEYVDIDEDELPEQDTPWRTRLVEVNR